MADLLSILNNAASGLAAHQVAIATAGHNLQNVNTPGYARQRAELAATSPAQYDGRAYIGRGVTLATVSQARDTFLERQVPTATAAEARASAESDALSSVTALDPDGAGSITEALGAFYSSLRALSQNAGDSGLRAQVIASARSLAQAFNGAASGIEDARTALDAKLSGSLADVNDAARTVASLNTQIQLARSGGAEPNDLLDARQTAANELARLTGASQVPTASGDLQIILPGGGALVSGGKAGALGVAGDAAKGGHLALTLTRADGTSAGPLAAGGVGGALGGVLDARDGALVEAGGALDQLASDLTSALNAVHTAGVGLDGVSGRNLFVAQAAVSGAAGRMAVDPAVGSDGSHIAAASTAAALPGDASNLLKLVSTESQPLSGGQAADAQLSSIVTTFGARSRQAGALAAQQSTILRNVEQQRDSVSSVSIDEEMVNLTKAQRAYEAVAKVLKTADEMLDTLMSIGG